MSNNLTFYIRDYLMEHKTISLEKIGILTLTQGTVSTEEGQTLPEVKFQYDKTAPTSPEFIEYVTQLEKKNPSIVQSDIEYFLDESRQLMNIGTSALIINGIGYILSEKTGGYAFSQQPVAGFRDTEARKKFVAEDIYDRTNDDNGDTEEDHSLKGHTSGPQINYLAIIIAILLLGGIAYAIYYFVNKPADNDAITAATDTTNTAQPADTVNVSQQQTASAQAQPAATASDVYKYVFETTPDPSRAQTRIAKLKSYGDNVAYDSVQTNKGLIYRLYAPVSKSSDSTKVKDSLFRYFQKPIRIAKFNP